VSGVFTIIFDDGSRSQLELGLPVLASHIPLAMCGGEAGGARVVESTPTAR
jgi:hypothetical protein